MLMITCSFFLYNSQETNICILKKMFISFAETKKNISKARLEKNENGLKIDPLECSRPRTDQIN